VRVREVIPIAMLALAFGGSLLDDHRPTMPDLLPPGHRPVRHELALEWPAERDWRFVASPTRGFEDPRLIARGAPFAFSTKYGTKLYALPAGAAVPAEEHDLSDVDWPSCAVPVQQVTSVPRGLPLARIVTTLRVTAIDGRDIRLARVCEQRFDDRGRELGDLDWLPLAVLAAAGAICLFALDRRVLRSMRARTEAT
jgi:hypothetical protein